MWSRSTGEKTLTVFPLTCPKASHRKTAWMGKQHYGGERRWTKARR